MRSISAVFPILSENVSSLFDQKRSCFVKFTRFVRLKKGSRIVFYLSKEKKLVGEGTIVKVEKMDPEIAWIRYGRQIFLTESEYNQYVAKSPISRKERKMTEITIFILKNLKRYKKLVKSAYNVPPSGFYLSQEEYQRISEKVDEND